MLSSAVIFWHGTLIKHPCQVSDRAFCTFFFSHNRSASLEKQTFLFKTAHCRRYGANEKGVLAVEQPLSLRWVLYSGFETIVQLPCPFAQVADDFCALADDGPYLRFDLPRGFLLPSSVSLNLLQFQPLLLEKMMERSVESWTRHRQVI